MSTSERQIPLQAAEAIAADPTYRFRPSTGLLPGRHWRRTSREGCIHLRINGGKAWMHRDYWDPGRFPVEHVVEVVLDIPRLFSDAFSGPREPGPVPWEWLTGPACSGPVARN